MNAVRYSANIYSDSAANIMLSEVEKYAAGLFNETIKGKIRTEIVENAVRFTENYLSVCRSMNYVPYEIRAEISIFNSDGAFKPELHIINETDIMTYPLLSTDK